KEVNERRCGSARNHHNALLERIWWNNYVKHADEIEREFSRLFHGFGLNHDLQDSYVPLVALKWMQVPNFNVSRFSPPDTKIVKSGGLRSAANQLAEFEKLSFQEIAARVEEMDRKSRERLIVPSTWFGSILPASRNRSFCKVCRASRSHLCHVRRLFREWYPLPPFLCGCA